MDKNELTSLILEQAVAEAESKFPNEWGKNYTYGVKK